MPPYQSSNRHNGFWDLHAIHQEKNMAQRTYEEGFKDGVTKATEPILPENKEYENARNMHQTLNEDISVLLQNRRKALLTKKVTKWIRVYNGSPSILGPYPGDWFYDCKEEAEDKAETSDRFIGAFPIEIEVPL